MQVILNIDDDVLRDMQMHADIKDEELNVMLSNMFIRFVAEPGKVISEETLKDGCESFENFHMRMINLLTITAHDSKNAAMREVLIKLREHVKDMHIMTDLYKTYKATR